MYTLKHHSTTRRWIVSDIAPIGFEEFCNGVLFGVVEAYDFGRHARTPIELDTRRAHRVLKTACQELPNHVPTPLVFQPRHELSYDWHAFVERKAQQQTLGRAIGKSGYFYVNMTPEMHEYAKRHYFLERWATWEKLGSLYVNLLSI